MMILNGIDNNSHYGYYLVINQDKPALFAL